MNRDDVERALRAYFARRQDVVVAYLFGSYARGEANERSDVDVAVLFFQVPADPLDAIGMGIAAELSGELGRDADVVVLSSAPADLIHRVLRDGVLVAERDRSRRIAFEMRARNQYFDILPWLRRYRRQPVGMT